MADKLTASGAQNITAENIDRDLDFALRHVRRESEQGNSTVNINRALPSGTTVTTLESRGFVVTTNDPAVQGVHHVIDWSA